MEFVESRPLYLVSGKTMFLTTLSDCAKFNSDFDQYCYENDLGMMIL